jgi:hypothetical protein
MLFSTDRSQLRQLFIEAWRKQQQAMPMQPLEQMIGEVVLAHPEYHGLLADPAQVLDKDFPPEAGESNPFLHMAMHISLQEQIASDRPSGIAALHQRLAQRLGDVHQAEHQLMECLAQMLWEAQVNQRLPDEQAYLACVRKLVSP